MITALPRTAARAGAAAAAAVALTAGLLGAPNAHAAQATGRVTGAQGVNARQAPTTHATFKGTIAKGATVTLSCKVSGPTISGNSLWYKLADGRWISARWVANVGRAPEACPMVPTNTAEVAVTSTVTRRTGPSTADAARGTVRTGTRIAIRCQLVNQDIQGNPRWYLTMDNAWISARYLRNLPPGPAGLRYPAAC